MDNTQTILKKSLNSSLPSSTELAQHLSPSMKIPLPIPPYQENDPKVLLSNLIFLEEKVHQLQGVVQSMIRESVDPTVRFQSSRADVSGFLLRQQIVVADTASIAAQLISTTGRLLHGRTEMGLAEFGELGHLLGPQNSQDVGIGSSVAGTDSIGLLNFGIDGFDGGQDERKTIPIGVEEGCGNWVEKHVCSIQDTEIGSANRDLGGVGKDGEEEEDEKVDSPPVCYEVLEVDKEEILAPHTHFCVICGKGFKRDANLRMHMRGHGDVYKTMEALANPNKGTKMTDLSHFRRYSCPFEGCKRNRKHKKFLPLKTILCVKNHYKRSHCDKSYVCSRCNSKRFSVIADLKTHEKHCGEDKWQCSCGTTFSRKDKLFGHVSLFQGHSPVLPANDFKGAGIPDVVVDRKNDDGKIGLRAPTPNCCPVYTSSANLSREAGYKRDEFEKNHQTVLTETHFPSEENSCNFTMDDIVSADRLLQLSPTLMGSAFSFHALLSCGFIETNGGDPNCSDA